MKKYFFCLIVSFLLLLTMRDASAWYDTTQIDMVTHEIQVQNGLSDDTWELTQRFVFQNTTDEVQPLFILLPLRSGASNAQVYQDFEGKAIQLWQGKEKQEFLFGLENLEILSLVAPEFGVLEIRDATIEPGAQSEIKISAMWPLDFYQDFFFTQIPLGYQGEGDVIVNLSLDSSQPLEHWFDTFSRGYRIFGDDQMSLAIRKQLTQKELFGDLRLGFSYVREPVVTTMWRDAIFEGHFVSRFEYQEPEKVQIFIDQSGSMSGDRWERTPEIITNVLNFFPDTLEVQLILFDDEEIEEVPEYVLNNFEFQKRTFDLLDQIIPVGKTDIKQIFPLFDPGALQIIVTDEDLKPYVDSLSDSILFHFGESESDASFFSHQGIRYIKLFDYVLDFIEQDNWEYVMEFWQDATESQKSAYPKNFLPRLWEGGRLSVSRFEKNDGETSHFWSHMLARYWGQGKIASILRKEILEDYDLDEILALGRIYGIETELWGPDTSRNDLRENIAESREDFLTELTRIFMYVPQSQSLNYRIYGDDVFYRSDDGWKDITFDVTANQENILAVERGSDEHLRLLDLRPDIFVSPTSVADDVSWCQSDACFRLIDDGELQGNFLQLLNDYRQDHWANGAFARLWERGVFHFTQKDMSYGGVVTRRDLGEMIVEIFYPQEWKDYAGQEVPFVDVTTEADIRLFGFLASQGIYQGYGDNTVRPDNPLAREEVVKVLLSLQGVQPNPVEESSFADVTGWSIPWVEEGRKRGILQGYPDGRFQPKKAITRAEVAVLLDRIMEGE